MANRDRGRGRTSPRRLPSKVQLLGTGVVAKFIVKRHARVDANGHVVHCYAARGMREHRDGRSSGKVVYDSEQAALGAAKEFQDSGLVPHNAYPCHRQWDRDEIGHEHWHLTTMDCGSDFVQQAG